MKIDDILVPVDFSANSEFAVEFAQSLLDPKGSIYLLHVIDSDFVSRLSEEGFSDSEAATKRLRKKAEAQLKKIVDRTTAAGLEVDSMVVVGTPFAEILRVANDQDFELIVLGIHGRRERNIDELLFGSTAEKVLRGTRIPVVCIPDASE